MMKAKYLLIILGLATLTVQAQTKKSILFVCEHGAARSVIAAAYFNKLAKESGLNYEAQFRGTDPQDSLTSGTKLGLSKDGFAVSNMTPQGVSQQDLNRADHVITFDCKLPDALHSEKLSQWNGIPPISEDYDVARNQIVARVKKLILELQKKQ